MVATMSFDDVYRTTMAAIAYLKDADLAERAGRVVPGHRAAFLRWHLDHLTPRERSAVEAFFELKLTGVL
jgi:hypothetical protein